MKTKSIMLLFVVLFAAVAFGSAFAAPNVASLATEAVDITDYCPPREYINVSKISSSGTKTIFQDGFTYSNYIYRPLSKTIQIDISTTTLVAQNKLMRESPVIYIELFKGDGTSINKETLNIKDGGLSDTISFGGLTVDSGYYIKFYVENIKSVSFSYAVSGPDSIKRIAGFQA